MPALSDLFDCLQLEIFGELLFPVIVSWHHLMGDKVSSNLGAFQWFMSSELDSEVTVTSSSFSFPLNFVAKVFLHQ